MTQTFETIDFDQEIIVYEQHETLPEGARKVGELSAGDSGFSTNCGYDVVMEKLLSEARKNGAQAIQIYEHKMPNVWSTCHNIKAFILRFPDDFDIHTEIESRHD